MSAPGSRRLYFALWPSAEQGRALLAATRPEIDACGGRAVAVHKLHVTLCFLGSVPAEGLDTLIRIGAAAAAQCSQPVTLRLDRVLRWRAAQVLCAVCGRDPGRPPVRALAACLRVLAVEAGYTPDAKPFRPHVTLARQATRSIRPRAIEGLLWSFTRFALVESRTAAEGPQYSIVAQFELYGSAA